MNDIPKFHRELFAAFVLAGSGSATLESVDASEAVVCILFSELCYTMAGLH